MFKHLFYAQYFYERIIKFLFYLLLFLNNQQIFTLHIIAIFCALFLLRKYLKIFQRSFGFFFVFLRQCLSFVVRKISIENFKNLDLVYNINPFYMPFCKCCFTFFYLKVITSNVCTLYLYMQYALINLALQIFFHINVYTQISADCVCFATLFRKYLFI